MNCKKKYVSIFTAIKSSVKIMVISKKKDLRRTVCLRFDVVISIKNFSMKMLAQYDFADLEEPHRLKVTF